LTGAETGFIVNGEIHRALEPLVRREMGSFGEDLRKQRLSRGMALEEIAAVTKIGRRYLEALEQEKFDLLPGGILSKGMVRGYASAVGLNQSDWTERFMRAYTASGQMIDDDRSWLEFASNVGKARHPGRIATDSRLRWLGAILLLLAIMGTCLAVRYFGVRAGWWPTLLPAHGASSVVHAALVEAAAWING